MVLPPVTSQPLLPRPAPAGPAGQAVAATPTTSPQANTAAAEAPGLTALQSVLASARLGAATMQDGMAVLMANVLRASAAGNLPPTVQSAVQQVMSLQMPTDKTPDASAVKNAMLASGLFTEAALAHGETPPADLKTALAQLAGAAQRWLAKTPANQPQTETPAPSVPPPVRGGQPVAQSPATPSLPQNAIPALTAKLLTTGSEAALARQNLLQMASLPDQQQPGETRWIFDVPLMTPQGPAVAQLIVPRDGKDSTAESPEPVWRIGLAMDIEPLGPVRANLALSGGHAWVTISADRPDSLNKLANNSSWLTDALTAATLESDIAFQSGTGASSARRSRLVDRAS